MGNGIGVIWARIFDKVWICLPRFFEFFGGEMGEVGSRVCVGGRFCFGGVWWGGDGIGVLDMDGCWVETVGRGRLGVGLGWVGGMGIGVGDGIGVG